jgi:hypothetical protein
MSNTSIAAPAIRLFFNALINACSSPIGPRDVSTTKPASFSPGPGSLPGRAYGFGGFEHQVLASGNQIYSQKHSRTLRHGAACERRPVRRLQRHVLIIVEDGYANHFVRRVPLVAIEICESIRGSRRRCGFHEIGERAYATVASDHCIDLEIESLNRLQQALRGWSAVRCRGRRIQVRLKKYPRA